MKKAADLITDNLSYLLFILAAGWAGGFAVWAVNHPNLLESLLLTNQLPPAQRLNLFWLTLAGSALALLLWLALGRVAVLTKRPALLTMQRCAALAFPAALLAFLPVLSVKPLAATEPFLVFFLVAAMASIVFVAINRASRLFGPLPKWTEGLASARIGLVIACGLALAYVVFMSVLTVSRHNSFMTHSFDLGIHDQIINNALHQGVLRSTQHGPQPINYLGNHFAPILFLLAPLYALKQDARTLLVLQSLFLGLGAVPIYLLAQVKLRSTALALVLSASYLLFPALHGINTFDFHQIALVTSLLLWSLYFLETGRTKLFLILLIAAAATKEEVALTVAAIGVYLFFVKRRYLFGAVLAVSGTAYFALVVGYVMRALGGVPQVYRFAGLMAPGSNGLPAVATTLFTNPTYALTYVFGDPRKLEFLFLLLLPVLFLPLLAGRSLVLAIPAFSVALLASTEENFSIGTQYPAIMIPFVSFLAIIGIQRLDRRKLVPSALAASILVASLTMNYEYGWLFGRSFDGIPKPTSHDRVVTSFFSQIPRAASVSTLSDLVPHLSNRETIYLFPTTQHADYILFDAGPKANFWPDVSRDARSVLTRALAPYLVSGEYGVERADDWVLLLKRAQDIGRNPAALGLLFSSQVEAEDLSSEFTSPPETDSQASGGRARAVDWNQPHVEERSGVTYGPYASLLPGKYRVTYRLKLDSPSARQGPVATVDVFSTAMGGALAGEDLPVEGFRSPGAYETFSLDVEIPRPLDDIEYRVIYQGPERLWVDVIDVTPLQITIPVSIHEAENLPGDSTVVADSKASGGMARASQAPPPGGDSTPAVMMYGPYASLAPGRYRANFALELNGIAPPGKVATVEVYSKSAGGPLASLDVGSADFKALDAYQDFSLDFQLADRWTDIEFRVTSYGQGQVRADYVQDFYLLSQ